jgi:serine/threonine-protein kinase RsbW
MSTGNLGGQECCLTVPSDLGYLPVIRGFVGSVAAHTGFSSDDQERIALAVEEAATNVIEHAFAPDESATFDVSCRRVPAGLEVRVHDKGMPYDPDLSTEYDPDRGVERQEGAGLGRFLMRHLMDEYHYKNLGLEGKEIRLIKYLDSPSVVGDPSAAPRPEEHPEPAAPPAKPIEFEVRRMRPEEAVEVARCVYDCYGYSYAGEHIYHPRRVAALNASGDILSAVAVTADGEIAGHNALVFHGFLPPELAVAATKRRFRGAGIAASLSVFLIEEARSMGVRAIHAKQVTVHPYTQRFCRKLGYRDSGFLLGHSPKSMSFRGISDEPSQRNSDVIGCLFLASPGPAKVHPPARHAEIIGRLLDNLEIQAEIVAPPSAHDYERVAAGTVDEDETRTALHVSVSVPRASAEMRVPRSGGDVLETLKAELHRLRSEEVRVIELYLDLADPVTARVVPELEELGFLFTGVMPATTAGPALVMQFLNGVQIEYDDLAVVSDMARELLDYIKANDPYAA